MNTAKIVAVTQPKVGGMSNIKEFIAYCARVSNPGNQNNHKNSEKLLNYLMKHAHWSPFEMASITMEIKTTRDIGRQILRHRSFSFQEFSQRYAVAENFISNREARLQDMENRQNSIEVHDEELQKNFESMQRAMKSLAAQTYQSALDAGIAKEQARALLPEGLTETTLYMSGTIRSWIHYIQLRAGHGTQKEHMEIAQACAKAIKEETGLEILDD